MASDNAQAVVGVEKAKTLFIRIFILCTSDDCSVVTFDKGAQGKEACHQRKYNDNYQGVRYDPKRQT